ncbi:uncharacterized protein LOC110813701 [Carica papaya]|uniref:uncharacterized protein LOC110813701 n=1 Tax=Carica papaya TaxID=3649 RepID=UPI000B8C891D|nr:uncharacterized protein LOC110813701 [Carica papaya]
MKRMETIQDLIEEAKVRTVWWAICIFAVTYFLSHTSTSMWMNLPIAILIVCGLRILSNEVEFSWKVRMSPTPTYLSHLEKKQLSVNDSRLSSAIPPPKWKRKIDSPVVEAAINDFIDKILKDFVINLWYSEITPDREAPELMRAVIMDALGEISGRVKEINLVDLLTRDIVDLIGDHLDLFRRNQAAIGADVMKTLSSEERDDRLKYHLIVSKELHPALMSPESEYKVLQRLISGVLSVVLRPREAQCPLVRTIARELVTCLVLQPIMNFASPVYVNEVIELVVLAISAEKDGIFGSFGRSTGEGHSCVSTSQKGLSSNNQEADMTLAKFDDGKKLPMDHKTYEEEAVHPQPADWARMLEAATQRRTEVLTPENLENMWTKGRNYKKKEYKKAVEKGSTINCSVSTRPVDKEMNIDRSRTSSGAEDKAMAGQEMGLNLDIQLDDANKDRKLSPQDFNKASSFEGGLLNDEKNAIDCLSDGNKNRLKRSNSTSDLKPQPGLKKAFVGDAGGPIITEFYNPDFVKHNDEHGSKKTLNLILQSEGLHAPKLRCRVMGAYFEKLGSKSFAVYSIAVTDAEKRTWFVKRRYSNFERLHRHLKEIPNYTLHLPPKRIFSSSTEDAFVHQRCIQLDKYLRDLLSIANVAEQHEVWDFLSVSSKNYSFGKSSSVMRTLAVNVDDAVDDIVRQFRGVSDGFMRKVVGPSSALDEGYSPMSSGNFSCNADEMSKYSQHISEAVNGTSDNDGVDKDGRDDHEEDRAMAEANGWHSDNEVNSRDFSHQTIKNVDETENILLEKTHNSEVKSERQQGSHAANLSTSSDRLEDPVGMPPEWTPPNVSVPVLNLVDNVFQLKRRGWLSLLWTLHIQVVHWALLTLLWPGGVFFTKIGDFQSKFDEAQDSQKPFVTGQFGVPKVCKPGSFEEQLEATRRASDLKKLLFDGAPTALVSLIGPSQYRRCASDIYYFTQSTVCVKQLAYAILELVLKSVFPELRDLLIDIHEKMRVQPA